MKLATRQWIDRAEGDYWVVRHELQADNPVNEAICFHAQQCVEKYLKAVLQEANRPFPRTHDLAFLLNLGVDLWPEVKTHEEAVKALTSYAVAYRYPGESADPELATAAAETMTTVRALLRAKLLPSE